MSHRVGQHRRDLLFRPALINTRNIHNITIPRRVNIMVTGKCLAWVSAASTRSHKCPVTSVRMTQRFHTFTASLRLHACSYFPGVTRIMWALVRSHKVKQGFGKITRTSLFCSESSYCSLSSLGFITTSQNIVFFLSTSSWHPEMEKVFSFLLLSLPSSPPQCLWYYVSHAQYGTKLSCSSQGSKPH